MGIQNIVRCITPNYLMYRIYYANYPLTKQISHKIGQRVYSFGANNMLFLSGLLFFNSNGEFFVLKHGGEVGVYHIVITNPGFGRNREGVGVE